MNEYEAKQEAKRQRYEELARKNERESQHRYDTAMEQLSLIPPGQPILVGHHSERGHRAHLNRVDNNMRKSIEHSEKAEYYKQKAAGVGKGGISSDDPEAVKKLLAKLEKLEANQEYMKAVNKAVRLKDTAKGDQILRDMGVSDETIHELRTPDFAGRVAFPSYMLQNNNGNMRRIRERIEELRNAPTETIEHQSGDIRVIENADENRVQIIFPGKPPAEVRKVLKSHGFRWSRYNMAWQRHLNNAGRYAAEAAIKKINSL